MTEAAPLREVRFEYTNELPGLLHGLGVSLLATTYQAGKLVALGTHQAKLQVQLRSIERPMGLAVSADCLAVGAREAVWFADACADMARQVAPVGSFDGGYATQRASATGDIAVHDMAWGTEGRLWAVNTQFSCLCLCDEKNHFQPIWKPPFISSLAAEDRCHFNGLAVADGYPRYATMMSQTDTAEGWRPVKADAGCILSIPDGRCLVDGLCMPHSPRIFHNRLFALNSGRGALGYYHQGQLHTICKQPGFTRGLDFYGHYAFIGLSKIRETSIFSGIPIAENREDLKCGIAVVDLRTGRRAAHFEFTAGVDELFDVRILPGVRNPYLGGPHPHGDIGPTIWRATPLPNRQQADRLLRPMASVGGLPIQELQVSQERLTPQFLEQFNAAVKLAERQQYEQAIETLRRCASQYPDVSAVHCNLGAILQLAGRPEEALEPLRTAYQLAPENPASQFNLSMAELRLGAFASGWQHYEARGLCGQAGTPPEGIEQWGKPGEGRPPAGSTMLIYGEQGIGDEIMFFSLLRRLQNHAPDVRLVVACDPRLLGMLRRNHPQLTVISKDCLSAVEYQRLAATTEFRLPCGSLPRVLGFPDSGSGAEDSLTSLVADPQRVAYWREELGRYAAVAGATTCVGFSWTGGKNAQEQAARSIPLQDWRLLLASEPRRLWVNLQYGPAREQLREADDTGQATDGLRNVFSPDRIAPLVDLDELAALMVALDRVITIDNSTLHLAGALGCSAVGVLPLASSAAYRWRISGATTYWYPSVRLVRRTPRESPAEVLRRALQQCDQFPDADQVTRC